MTARVWMEHPDLPGQPICVDERNIAGHGASGWVVCDAPPPAPKAPTSAKKEPSSTADPDPDPEVVPAPEKPARRRAPKEAEEQ